jgi:hypothetical protein
MAKLKQSKGKGREKKLIINKVQDTLYGGKNITEIKHIRYVNASRDSNGNRGYDSNLEIT